MNPTLKAFIKKELAQLLHALLEVVVWILLIEFIQVNVRSGVPMRRAALEASAIRYFDCRPLAKGVRRLIAVTGFGAGETRR